MPFSGDHGGWTFKTELGWDALVPVRRTACFCLLMLAPWNIFLGSPGAWGPWWRLRLPRGTSAPKHKKDHKGCFHDTKSRYLGILPGWTPVNTEYGAEGEAAAQSPAFRVRVSLDLPPPFSGDSTYFLVRPSKQTSGCLHQERQLRPKSRARA